MPEFRSPDQVLPATAPPLQTLAASVLGGLASTTHRAEAASTTDESTVNQDGRVPEAPIAEVQDRPFQLPTGVGIKRGKRLVKPDEAKKQPFTPPQRLLILDSWQRSGLPAKDFGALVGVSGHTLYAWKKQFAEHGPAGLMDHPRLARRSTLRHRQLRHLRREFMPERTRIPTRLLARRIDSG